MMAKILSLDSLSADLTIGSDKKTASDIKNMGSNHINCLAQGVIVDKDNNIVSTPAYMEAKNISEVAEGIEKLVLEVLNMIK